MRHPSLLSAVLASTDTDCRYQIEGSVNSAGSAVGWACRLTGEDLADWGAEMERYPQILRNLRISERPDLATHPTIGPVIEQVTAKLEDRGRVLVRYSGTEKLARVMVEGESESEIDAAAAAICDAIEASIGVGDEA